MLQDIETGRWTEIGFINGAVVDRGAVRGIPMPVNAALVRQIRFFGGRRRVRVPFQDLRIDSPNERKTLLKATEAVLAHGHFVLGPEVDEFQDAVAARLGRRYAVAVGSGFDALLLGLRALGIEPGNEVIVPAFSEPGVARVLLLAGARPVFADVGPDLTIDPAAVKAQITDRTRAVIATDWAGRLPDLETLLEVAGHDGLPVVEHAAHAFGAERAGHKAGTSGTIGCFCMGPERTLAAGGQFGLVVTDNEAVTKCLKGLRAGCTDGSDSRGGKLVHDARPDTLQGALLLKRLNRVDGVIRIREEHAHFYEERLAGIVGTPPVDPGERHAYWSYTVLAEDRDRLKDQLVGTGIDARVVPESLLLDHPALEGIARGNCPRARELHAKVLSLPVHEKLTDTQLELVVNAVEAFYGKDQA